MQPCQTHIEIGQALTQQPFRGVWLGRKFLLPVSPHQVSSLTLPYHAAPVQRYACQLFAIENGEFSIDTILEKHLTAGISVFEGERNQRNLLEPVQVLDKCVLVSALDDHEKVEIRIQIEPSQRRTDRTETNERQRMIAVRERGTNGIEATEQGRRVVIHLFIMAHAVFTCSEQ